MARWKLRLLAFTLMVGAMAPPALAQGQVTPSSPAGTGATSGSGWWPASGRNYLGLNVGRSRYDLPCGATAFTCDRNDTSAHLYAGALLGNFWGAELGYVDMGRVARGGGNSRARGLNLSAVGRVPLGSQFGLYGKLGATYGRTETSALPASGLAGGSETGVGLSYGAGISYDFTPRLSAVLAWDSHDFRFAGNGREPVRATSLGLQYRY